MARLGEGCDPSEFDFEPCRCLEDRGQGQSGWSDTKRRLWVEASKIFQVLWYFLLVQIFQVLLVHTDSYTDSHRNVWLCLVLERLSCMAQGGLQQNVIKVGLCQARATLAQREASDVRAACQTCRPEWQYAKHIDF